jgi:uncharacterized membrane protein
VASFGGSWWFVGLFVATVPGWLLLNAVLNAVLNAALMAVLGPTAKST